MRRLENKIELGFLPTPIHELKNLSAEFLNFRLFIKRDDQTGLATGGNKTRKLEFLLKEAIDLECDTIITAGAKQSNHCRQTAAASAQLGLTCHLMLGGNKPKFFNGNILLSKLLGAEIHFCGANRKGEDIELLKNELISKGLKPYVIPYGGTNLTGAFGYINAIKELKIQAEESDLKFDYIFFASSSGGTLSGMILGKIIYNYDVELMPINIDKNEGFEKSQIDIVSKIVSEGIDQFKLSNIDIGNEIKIIEGYDKTGYGNLTSKELNSIKSVARSEGILLDPVYTARAFYAMTDFLRKKLLKPNSNLLFWHTGGLPANFEYSDRYFS